MNIYGLLEGDNIQITVTAENEFGLGPLSHVNFTSVTQVITVPHKPCTLPQRGNLTSQNQIQILISEFQTNITGGSSIVSYIISWDQGLGTGVFVDLFTEIEFNLQTQYLIVNVTSGVYY